ncbi:MAG: prolipoprotein diacylglyceryl transferase [Deltaproteobacteria bacterium]|nr:prolipoprotein diacylglyceryl transferase [Deltaproteobacteria bacterium]
MLPVLFELRLTPPVATWLLFGLALAIPAFYAFRAWQDVRDGFEEDPRKPLKEGGIWLAGLLLLVGAVLRPWTWAGEVTLPLHTYGVMMAIAFVSGITVATREGRRSGLDADRLLDLAFWLLVSGLVGARLLFILVNLDQYFGENFYSADLRLGGPEGLRVPNLLIVWRGGLVFFGGLLGAFATATYYLWRNKLPYFRYIDVIVLAAPIGHFFGRLGCFAAGCCWGKACDPASPFATYFPNRSLAYLQTPIDEHVQHAGEWTTQALYPTQLFESLGVLLIFFALIWLQRRKRFNGQVLIFYFILYPLFRTLNETFRGDWERGLLFRWPAEDPVMLSTSQIISFGVAALGVGLLVFLRRRRGRAGEGQGPTGAAAT